MRFCLAMGWYWEASDVGEARPWLETVVNQAAGHDCPLLAEAISELAVCLSLLGEYDDALDLATAAIDMWERMGHQDPVWSYFILGLTYYNSGETELGLELLNDAEVRVRKTTDRSKVMVVKLVVVLKTLGTIEGRRGEEARSAELLDEARSLAVALGDRVVPLDIDTGEALRLMEAGHVVEAKSRFRSLIPRHLAIHYRDGLVDIADLYGIALTRVGEYETASALILASRAARTRSGLQVHRDKATDLEAAASECEQAISTAAWLAIQDEVCDASLADVLAESYEKS